MNPEDENTWKALLRQAWISSAMEKDKTIIALSSGGIALLVNLLSELPEWAGAGTKLLYFTALSGFTISILGGVGCFEDNKRIIKRQLNNEPEEPPSSSDTALTEGFCLGVASFAAIGFTYIVYS